MRNQRSVTLRCPLMTTLSAAASSDSITAQCGSDTAHGDLVLAVEALGIDTEQHLDAVAGPLCHLGRGHSPVEPGRQACVPKIVRPARELGAVLLVRQRSLARLLPCPPVGDGGKRAALDATEERICWLTRDNGKLVAERFRQGRWAWDRPSLTLGSVF